MRTGILPSLSITVSSLPSILSSSQYVFNMNAFFLIHLLQNSFNRCLLSTCISGTVLCVGDTKWAQTNPVFVSWSLYLIKETAISYNQITKCKITTMSNYFQICFPSLNLCYHCFSSDYHYFILQLLKFSIFLPSLLPYSTPFFQN